MAFPPLHCWTKPLDPTISKNEPISWFKENKQRHMELSKLKTNHLKYRSEINHLSIHPTGRPWIAKPLEA